MFSDKDNNDNYTGSVVVSSRIDAISNMRDLVTSTRNETVASLDAIIASADTTVVDKENALKEKQTLSDLTEKEVEAILGNKKKKKIEKELKKCNKTINQN